MRDGSVISHEAQETLGQVRARAEEDRKCETLKALPVEVLRIMLPKLTGKLRVRAVGVICKHDEDEARRKEQGL
jgi:hypothetical protein